MFTSLSIIVLFLLVKLVTKFIGVWPLTREGNYTTLLMSTGLTFGSISALYGLTNHIINQTQYTILVAVVIRSAVVPTFIVQNRFLPHDAKTRVSSASDAEASEIREVADVGGALDE